MAVLLSSVIEDVITEMTERGFSDDYISFVKRELKKFMNWSISKGEKYFSEKYCEEYCIEKYSSKLYGEREKKSQANSRGRAAIRRLASMGVSSTIDYYVAKSKQEFFGRFSSLFNSYINWQESNGYAPSTITAKHGYLYDFCIYIEGKGIEVKEIQEAQLESFFSSLNKPLASLHAYRKIIRGFLRFLYNEGLTTNDLSLFVREDNYRSSKELLPTVIKIEDVKESLLRINRTTAIGKRDYAIVLLTAELGIRPSDIALLQMNSIDWDKKTICYRQEKTKVVVTQPLTTTVGNAIIDYIMNGRSKSSLETIFLSSIEEKAMARNSVATVIKRHLKGCAPICGEKQPGARVLRATLASQLIKENKELPIVSAILGHTTINTAKHYVAIDFEGLKKCALPIPPVKSPLYEANKGGTK